MLPTLFIPHGGGPWPFMDKAFGPPGMWDGLRAFSPASPRAFPRGQRRFWPFPRRLGNSAPGRGHGRRAGMLFDYYGFPEHTYRLEYPAPGAPQLAGRVRDLLAKAALPCDGVTGRGFDHGVFMPFMLIYPQADMPICRCRCKNGASVAEHLAIKPAGAGAAARGRRADRRQRHELSQSARVLLATATPRASPPCNSTTGYRRRSKATLGQREAALIDWRKAPGAKQSHPTPEHLEPLFVVAGAAGEDVGRRVLSGELAGKPVSGFRFG